MLDPFSSLDQKKGFIALLFKMTEADQRLHPKELEFIVEAGNQIGFSMDEIVSIGREYYKYELIIPADERERMTMLYYLLFLMRIDAEINPKEEIFAKMLGFKLGFNNLMLDEMVEIMKDHVNKKLPEDLLLDKVKKYLN